MKAKLIFDFDPEEFEKNLNDFIATVKVIDIKFTMDPRTEDDVESCYNALVLYDSN